MKTLLQNVGSGASITSPLGLTIITGRHREPDHQRRAFGMPGFNFPDPPGSTAHQVTAYDSALKVLGGAWTMEAQFTLNALPGLLAAAAACRGSLVMGLCGMTYGSWNSSTAAPADCEQYRTASTAALAHADSIGQCQLPNPADHIHRALLRALHARWQQHADHRGQRSASTFSVSAGSMSAAVQTTRASGGTYNDGTIYNHSDQYYLALRHGVGRAPDLLAWCAAAAGAQKHAVPQSILGWRTCTCLAMDQAARRPVVTRRRRKVNMSSPALAPGPCPEGWARSASFVVGMRAKISGHLRCRHGTPWWAIRGRRRRWRRVSYYELLPNPDQGGGGGAFGGNGAPYIWCHTRTATAAAAPGAIRCNELTAATPATPAWRAQGQPQWRLPTTQKRQINGQGVSLLGITPGGGRWYRRWASDIWPANWQRQHALAPKNAVAVASGVTVTFEKRDGRRVRTRLAAR